MRVAHTPGAPPIRGKAACLLQSWYPVAFSLIAPSPYPLQPGQRRLFAPVEREACNCRARTSVSGLHLLFDKECVGWNNINLHGT